MNTGRAVETGKTGIPVPAAGGLLAGLTLLVTHRFVPAKATEYMEAVALGNGYVPQMCIRDS